MLPLQLEMTAPKGAWKPIDTITALANVYNHLVPRSNEFRVNGSNPWTALAWAVVLRNPFPKTSPGPWDGSVRRNPSYWEEFQNAYAARLTTQYARKGLSICQEETYKTGLGYNPRVDIAVYDGSELKLIFECKDVHELRVDEVLQCVTYQLMLKVEVRLVVPDTALVEASALSILTAAGIPLVRYKFRPPRTRR